MSNNFTNLTDNDVGIDFIRSVSQNMTTFNTITREGFFHKKNQSLYYYHCTFFMYINIYNINCRLEDDFVPPDHHRRCRFDVRVVDSVIKFRSHAAPLCPDA